MVCSGYMDGASSSNCDISIRSKLNGVRTVKQRIATVNFVAIVAALYLYDRHNRYCEPGVYSMFSLLEYVVIVANIVYHLQAYTDLGDYSIIVAPQRFSPESKKLA